ncbi:MAG: electron transfer flavoprotein subunit alpha/FixB family protein [Chloroflexi bacterium]|nr:electron transfer flavoprotein subunit alpha/FixB family protein [Chloroflexota bacterium]MCY3583613.1 electron transfer flavoprotein subunit alpha/FixB family protein [Chloroflexota bacterium]MCY3715743.1 electron transfer flavoprotein subunit alpha/FixB family protein [Chloroflexota bacterium]MDE2651262.1 electron transfer flavoprotein subunit alpha/FixB family protein [Chloroflexota bacterium]MXV93463.1 electron transfer flavoprotein subunit alpha/FixB family protein [Chloroflexota bacter
MTVFVWIESFAGRALPSSWEALGAANALASELGCAVTAIVFGENAQAIAAEAAGYGARGAFICSDASLKEYRPETYAALLSQLVAERKPKAVLAIASNLGRELLACAAGDTGNGLISDVIALRLDGENIIGARPAYAGKVLMEMRASTQTTFATLRARAFPSAAAVEGIAPMIQPVSTVDAPAAISSLVEGFALESGTVNLTDAAIIVSGGRGMANNPRSAPDGLKGEAAAIWKAKDGFANTLTPLAETLGAALGASRAAVDAGYIPYAHQVGQTGKVVSPDLYIACGISGAIQHQAGMRNSKIIVAINKDTQAPIFKLARYGIVGDLYEVVPALTAALRRRLG